MTIRFNAGEVLEIAVKIEENGAAFYRKAAKLRPSSEKAGILLLQRLADMEDEHRAVFMAMRANLPKSVEEFTTFDPYMEATLYLNAIADTQAGEGQLSVADTLTGEETLGDILRTAIGLEEKSINFYTGLQDTVPEELGKARIADIIKEEKQHVVTLVTEFRKLTKK